MGGREVMGGRETKRQQRMEQKRVEESRELPKKNGFKDLLVPKIVAWLAISTTHRVREASPREGTNKTMASLRLIRRPFASLDKRSFAPLDTREIRPNKTFPRCGRRSLSSITRVTARFKSSERTFVAKRWPRLKRSERTFASSSVPSDLLGSRTRVPLDKTPHDTHMLLVQSLIERRILMHCPVVPIPNDILDHNHSSNVHPELGPSGESEERDAALEEEEVEEGVLEDVEEVAAFEEGWRSGASEAERERVRMCHATSSRVPEKIESRNFASQDKAKRNVSRDKQSLLPRKVGSVTKSDATSASEEESLASQARLEGVIHSTARRQSGGAGSRACEQKSVAIPSAASLSSLPRSSAPSEAYPHLKLFLSNSAGANLSLNILYFLHGPSCLSK